MNILVFTAIYPITGMKQGFTPIVKYFCEDWVKLGHRVVVVSSTTKFPLPYYIVPECLNTLIENKVGFNVPSQGSRRKIYTTENGVEVFQLPVKKLFPGQNVSKIEISEHFKDISENYFKKIDFVPDIATGHWVVPQVSYLRKIKETFNIPTCLVLHSIPNAYEKKMISNNIECIDLVGFRSVSIQIKSNLELDLSTCRQFLCYSGVYDFYQKVLQEYELKVINKKCVKVCFVGNLISRKYPDVIIEALNNIPDINFEIHYVGEGAMYEKIKRIKRNKNLQIFFYGRMPRIEVYKVIEKCDFLVMISKDEAFGLVYLEAMLNRTIPIASYNEGFDGIIENGVNGYLCNSGDKEGLTKLFRHIIDADLNDLYAIQKKCFETAQQMTDSKMALQYLDQFREVM